MLKIKKRPEIFFFYFNISISYYGFLGYRNAFCILIFVVNINSNKVRMQKLFYVICRWLESEESKQAERVCSMIKNDMDLMGFKYDDISNTERQREELYREREKLLKEKQRL